MSEYASAINLAKRLIIKKGRSKVFVYRPVPGTATDIDRPWKLDSEVGITEDTLLASDLHVVFIDNREARGEQGQFGFEVSFRNRMDNMPGSLMLDATAIALLIPEELGSVQLEVGDLIVSDEKRYMVLRCDPLKPGNELILFSANLKG